MDQRPAGQCACLAMPCTWSLQSVLSSYEAPFPTLCLGEGLFLCVWMGVYGTPHASNWCETTGQRVCVSCVCTRVHVPCVCMLVCATASKHQAGLAVDRSKGLGAGCLSGCDPGLRETSMCVSAWGNWEINGSRVQLLGKSSLGTGGSSVAQLSYWRDALYFFSINGLSSWLARKGNRMMLLVLVVFACTVFLCMYVIRACWEYLLFPGMAGPQDIELQQPLWGYQIGHFLTWGMYHRYLPHNVWLFFSLFICRSMPNRTERYDVTLLAVLGESQNLKYFFIISWQVF